MRNLKWFKHYNDATIGETFQQLLIKKKPYAVILYWYLIEQRNKLSDEQVEVNLSGSGHELVLESTVICRRLYIRSDTLSSLLSLLTSTLSTLHVDSIGTSIRVTLDNYAKFQETRGKKKLSDAQKSVLDKNRREEKRIEEEENKNKKLKEDLRKKKKMESESKFNFLKLYDQYPKKAGKKQGLEKCKKIITSQEIYDRVEASMHRYTKICQEEGREKMYVKQFIGFINNWEDWDSDDAGTCTIKPKKNKNNYTAREDDVSNGNKELFHTMMEKEDARDVN